MKSQYKPLLPIFFLTVLLISACGGSTSTTQTSQHSKAPDNKQVLVSVVSAGAGASDFNTLDPAIVFDVNGATAIETMFTGLVSLDQQARIHAQLAQSWETSADGLTWTFHLKPDLKFSDGTPLTSHDVAYSIDRALQPATKSTTGLYYMGYIKDSDKLNGGKLKTIIGDSLLTPDDNTLKIVLSKPIAFFLDTMTYPCAFTVEKSVVEKYGTQWTDHLAEGGGAGPFKVKQYTHDKELDLIPNDNYYGPKPQLKELIYPFYKNADTTEKDYLINRLDDAVIPLANYEGDKTRPDFFQVPYLKIDYLGLNYTKKPFDNMHIRQAFALAINKELIAKQIWKGSYLATNHIVPQGMPGFDAGLTGPDGTTSLAGNAEKAKALLQQGLHEEGYSSVSQLPSISVAYLSGGVQALRDEMAAVQQMWQQVLGVNVKLNDVNSNIFGTNINSGVSANPYQSYQSFWAADYPDPQDWITLMFGKDTAQNASGFGQNNGPDAAAQQALQQQMTQADLMRDSTARYAAYNKIEQTLVNDVAWLPLDQETLYGLRKPCVQGFAVNSLGMTPPDNWSNIYISTATPCANVSVS
ncbi:peptide ABC transporter substrate-binding protein [Ktedonosporobacter rubrisoli]|uniref:Peptide ABC transporter substrate-binding protein n=1 Tax=Ktedonosporobacter rubrisoli TaxID=2509675 RepID=A0A4P6JKY4_KTERU|nr:peptide ABC transporter substrate-binding protein [Ktedonosporobacter rubrisoli]QBD75733.1 peptide ABC transporter substrate-binding protein [Ktedonosporobacter rubrisoli]